MGWYDDELLDRFSNVARDLGWESDWEMENGYLDIENWSPWGDSILISLTEDDFESYAKLTHRLDDEYQSFMTDEYATEWYERNRDDPHGIRNALENADGIDEILKELAEKTRSELAGSKTIDKRYGGMDI